MMTEYYLLFFFEVWESMASIAKLELLALIWKNTEVSEEMSTGAMVMIS